MSAIISNRCTKTGVCCDHHTMMEFKRVAYKKWLLKTDKLWEIYTRANICLTLPLLDHRRITMELSSMHFIIFPAYCNKLVRNIGKTKYDSFVCFFFCIKVSGNNFRSCSPLFFSVFYYPIIIIMLLYSLYSQCEVNKEAAFCKTAQKSRKM